MSEKDEDVVVLFKDEGSPISNFDDDNLEFRRRDKTFRFEVPLIFMAFEEADALYHSTQFRRSMSIAQHFDINSDEFINVDGFKKITNIEFKTVVAQVISKGGEGVVSAEKRLFLALRDFMTKSVQEYGSHIVFRCLPEFYEAINYKDSHVYIRARIRLAFLTEDLACYATESGAALMMPKNLLS